MITLRFVLNVLKSIWVLPFAFIGDLLMFFIPIGSRWYWLGEIGRNLSIHYTYYRWEKTFKRWGIPFHCTRKFKDERGIDIGEFRPYEYFVLEERHEYKGGFHIVTEDFPRMGKVSYGAMTNYIDYVTSYNFVSGEHVDIGMDARIIKNPPIPPPPEDLQPTPKSDTIRPMLTLHPVTVQRTERLTIMVEAETPQAARAEVEGFIEATKSDKAFAFILMEDWANENTREGVKVEIDPLVILPDVQAL